MEKQKDVFWNIMPEVAWRYREKPKMNAVVHSVLWNHNLFQHLSWASFQSGTDLLFHPLEWYLNDDAMEVYYDGQRQIYYDHYCYNEASKTEKMLFREFQPSCDK